MKTQDDTDHAIHSPAKVYSVPRRFDIATMLTVTVAFAVLFGVMRLLGSSPFVFLFVAGMITCVGAAQAVLFQGKSPRAASIVAGAVYAAVVTVISVVARGDIILVVGAFCASLSGAIGGYFAGILVAGVFLVSDYVRKWIGKETR